MNTPQYNSIVSFIWSIADDCLRDVYVRGKYRDVILPMVVLRRIDSLLEESKDKVIREVELQRNVVGSTELTIYRILELTGYRFGNISEWTLQRIYDKAKKNRLTLDSRESCKQLEKDFETYLDGFTQNIKDIIDRFKLRAQVFHMAEKGVLYEVLEKFTSPDINLTNKDKTDSKGRILPGLTNLDIGLVFEELIRRFNEENNEEAGEHFTPRDIIDLMTHLVFEPIKDKLPQDLSIYDPACGSGGMLTESKRFITARYNVPEEAVRLYGVEINDETYAICQSDMLIKGNRGDIICGSTIAQDHFKGKTFNFMLSNPPFGKSWAGDMKHVIGDKKEILDDRFLVELTDYWQSIESDPATPRSSDGQLLFLMEMADKIEPVSKTSCGSRIASVHNGSSLFTGDAESGESNIRRYIIENDLLEAIIQLPNNLFYNTGITTYIWLLTNNKAKERRGKVQLIDASELSEKLRKNLGNKNCQLSENNIEQLMQCYHSMENQEKTADHAIASLWFENKDFGYYKVVIERPKRLVVQFTEKAIDELRYDKSVIEPMKWAYSQYEDDIYTNLEKYTAAIENWCKHNKFELTTKNKTTLFSLSTWNKGRRLREIASKLMRKIGEERWMDYNLFIKIFDDTLIKERIKLTSGERKAILGAISNYDPQAKKVIKKCLKLSFGQLTELATRFNCKIKELPDFGFYPTEDNKIWIEYESENDLRDFEYISLKENIYNHFKQEVKPYINEAWINIEATKIGYEISFNKYFYRHKPLRSLDEVTADILALEEANKGLINEVLSL